MKSATATAHTNIALVKYWGKRADAAPELNLPAVGSLSMTVDGLRTVTRITPGEEDLFALDGVPSDGGPAQRVFRHLDLVWRQRGGPRPRCQVVSTNYVPTAAGLASSASGFAALTVAAAAAFELDLDPTTLSSLSRMGSGSAARSIWGGFVRLDRGERADGADCLARPIARAEDWPLALVVVQVGRGAKPVGSTEGMERSRITSPYYPAWVDTSPADLDAAEAALRARDLPALGAVVEGSCFKMHACMMASVPPIVYWQPTTLAAIHAVWKARAEGVPGYVTMDAGPHVKVLTTLEHAEAMEERCREVPGVEAVMVCRPGPDASVEVGP